MLNALALRLATVQALRGRTYAGAAVLDSEQSAIDELATDRPTPVIIVYTDRSNATPGKVDLFATEGDGRVESGWTELLIEIVVTQRMKIITIDEETGLEVEDETAIQPFNDPSLAATLNLIERQVKRVLMDPRPSAPWSELWRRFVNVLSENESDLGMSQRDGVRFAGRQIKLRCQLHRDPMPGVAPGPNWARFLELAADVEALAPLVPVIEAELAGDDLEDWQIEQMLGGLSLLSARALHVTPGTEGAEATSPTMTVTAGPTTAKPPAYETP